ncbi:HipA family kinase [Jeotgalibacillus proteolyticus]|uniref:HipA-like kinase domain-containing protein n=1 Tax=Jeotgalibacillus proteolyticus TaxID=2082395 RepID=A0A2S5GAZ3_9BACL|nr:HipA family kinase [Jeotgalibacillus proteolyticus]PPA70166.1 hypothetical protein C4B60_11300 [Jeotgalibacillus proteolyticus]
MNLVDIPTQNAQKLEKFFTNGKTKPALMKTDEGFYVVKFSQNADGIKVLINEIICYQIAVMMGVPIPQAALINVEQEVIDADERLQEMEVKPGIHFGSHFLKKAQPSIQQPYLNLAKNTEDIPSIILFDQIIYNNDRTENKGNILFDLKEREIVAIDHSHPFKIGALWNETHLRQIQDEEFCLVRDFHGHNYRVLLKYVNGHNPFNTALQRLSNIDKTKIEECFDIIPEGWELSTAEKNALIEFIWHRIENVESLLVLLHEQCPHWKGGISFGA